MDIQATALLGYARLSPQKGGLVAHELRGMPVEKAREYLKFSPKKAAGIIFKVLESAIANAENNLGADIDELVVQSISVDEGPVMKRVQPRARGRANRIVKRTSHIRITVAT